MGVHLLLYWTAADGAGRREAFDALSDAILCLGSTATSRWTAQAAALRRVQAGGTDDLPSVRTAASEVSLHRVSLSDEPEQLLLLSRAAKQVLQAGADMQAFLDRLALYKARGSLQLEGSLHSLGDFSISLARAVQAPQQDFLGLALDLCYQPLDDAALAAPLLQDLAAVLQEAAQAVGGTLRQVADGGSGFQLPATFGPRHRAVQYVLLMSLLQAGKELVGKGLSVH
ncbi:Mediator of RNA polymerase II transcription subunit 20a [Chlorella vulgaris]